MASDTVRVEEGFAHLPQGRLHYLTCGSGRVLLLIHGIGGGSWMWERVMPSLGRIFRVLAVDLPGFHGSDSPRAGWTINDQTQVLTAFLSDRSVGKFDAVGHYLGAVLAIELAISQPGRLGRLVLNGCPCWTAEQGRRIYERHFAPRLDERGLPRPWTLDQMKGNTALNPDQRLVAQVNKAVLESGQYHVEYHQKLFLFDVVSRLPLVRVPALLVYGEIDSQRRTEQALQAAIQGSRVAIVRGSGTMPSFEAPDDFLKAVLEFLVPVL